jgi:hypothetical protein
LKIIPFGKYKPSSALIEIVHLSQAVSLAGICQPLPGMSNLMNRIVPAILVVNFICSCSASLSQDEFKDSRTSDRPALHAIQDQELRELMDRMNGLMLERFMTEHEMDVVRGKYTRQIIATAITLQNTAGHLVNKIPHLNLTTDEENAFRGLADKLSQYATLLKTQAEHDAFNAIPATLHEMKSTCAACHTLFRQF